MSDAVEVAEAGAYSCGVRTLAAILVATLGTWLATPAVASVTCRPEVVHCAHCPKPKPLPVAAMRTNCCIIKAAVAHPLADHVQQRYAVDAPAQVGAVLTFDVPSAEGGGLAASVSITITGSPPLGARNLPLLC